jgi:MFS family permease
MTAIGGVMFGFAGDRFGRKPTIIASVLIYGAGAAMCAFAHSFGSLLAWRSFTGLGIGGEWGAGQSLIAESVPPDRRARYAAYVQVGAPLGGLMAAWAGGYVEPHIGWRAVFLVSSAPAFVVAAMVWRWLPESDVWMRHGDGHWLALDDIRALRPFVRLVGLLFVVLLVNSEAYWFIYSWMPSYLRITRGLTQQASGAMMMRMQCGGIAGYAVFGRLADRFGRRPVFCAFAMMIAIGLLPATILWPWAIGIPGLVSAAMAMAGIGTGIWAGVGPMISEMLPTQVRNAGLGLLLNVTRGIQFFTPLMITFLSASIGFGATLSIGAIFSAAGGALVWLLPETRGQPITALDPAEAFV